MAFGLRALFVAAAMVSSLCGATLEIDGRLLKATATPTLNQIAPYPRALCTYLYEVEKVRAGKFEEDKILVVKWAVWDRKPLPGLPAEVGKVERLDLDRWIDYPAFKRQRVVDGVGEKELVIYYDVNSRPQKTVLEDVLKGRAQEVETGVVRGESKRWLFLAEELKHAETGRFWEKDWKTVSRAGVDPLPAMMDFQKRLKELGVELWLLPVPTKVSQHSHRLKRGLVLEPQRGYLVELEKAGLNVIDLGEHLEPNEKDGDGWGWHLLGDSHWSPVGCELASRLIAKRIGHLAAGNRERFTVSSPMRRLIWGDLAKLLPEKTALKDVVGFTLVWQRAGKGPGVGLSHPESPFVLLGDSHVTVFSEGGGEMHLTGAGLPDQLARQLGLEVDVIASHGDGVNQARVNLYQQRSINPKHPDYWKNKKAVIWVFASREFTRAESWSTKIPVVKKR